MTAAEHTGDAEGDIAVGTSVELRGLKSRTDLNGARGVVVARDAESGRFVVEIRRAEGPGGPETETVRCKPEHLLAAAARVRCRAKSSLGGASGVEASGSVDCAPAAAALAAAAPAAAPDAQKRTRVLAKTASAASDASEPAGPPAKRRATIAGPIYRAEVRDLVELVCDPDMMQAQVEEVGYDVGRAPLEELSRPTLREAFTWLNALEKELARPAPKAAALEMMSASFYETVALGAPGEQRLIDTTTKLEEKVSVLRSLVDVEAVYVRLQRLALGRGHKKLDEGQGEEDMLPHEKSSVGEVQRVESMLESIRHKKPQGAYFSWFKDSRARIAEALGGGATVIDVAKRAGEVWRDLPEEERAPYVETHRAAKEAYDAEEHVLLVQRAAAREAADPLVQRQYRLLSCDLEQVFPESKLGRMIQSLVETTKAATADPYSISVSRVFAVQRHGEEKSFARFVKDPNRMLLWHGARLCSWAGLLSQGLRFAPPEAPVAGCPFGKGLYFTDLVGRAVRSCLPGAGSDRQLVLLADVAMGRSVELAQPKPGFKKLPAGYNSIVGRGVCAPDPARASTAPDGARVLLGPALQRPVQGGAFSYNEYCVFNCSQVRMRYLVEVRLGAVG